MLHRLQKMSVYRQVFGKQSQIFIHKFTHNLEAAVFELWKQCREKIGCSLSNRENKQEPCFKIKDLRASLQPSFNLSSAFCFK